ncbi:hypothetical protein PRUPE_4G230300 [Prunus persica]|uniref:Uncharacterized protein n=1 Tax=Prunus persica TaxID=3760 RepID=M5WLA6_PRUPE|nr:hypothetical protein PRUPE_4G230300 [Prunus persica]
MRKPKRENKTSQEKIHKFFSARKHWLVDAAVRSRSSDRTAVVTLPGGILLERIGSELPVPFLLMNYDSFYSKLLGFLDDCKDCGILSNGEITSLWKVCDGNSEALVYLAGLEKDSSMHAKHEGYAINPCLVFVIFMKKTKT